MKQTWLLVTIWLVVAACSGHDEKPVAVPPTAKFMASDGVDRVILDGTASVSGNGNALVYGWNYSGNYTTSHTPQAGYDFIKIPSGAAGGVMEVTLRVNNGGATDEVTQSVSMPAYSLVRAYGLGQEELAQHSNDAATNWYRDQGQSGTYSLNNCGPASVTMAIKWANDAFSGTVEDARKTYRSSGGWWYTDDIANYLDKYSVTHYTAGLTTAQDFREVLDEGNIIILCLDMSYVGKEVDPEYHYNKFYAANTIGWGHFLVIKGYKSVRRTTETTSTTPFFMECYDPYSLSRTYDNNQLKGKNRYYDSNDLFFAAKNWWPYMIVVTKEGGETPSGSRSLNPQLIPVQHGG